MKLKITFLFIISLFSFGFAQYRVSLQGAKQAAMGHTSADASDASVLFFNPAGGVYNDNDYNLSLGGFGIGLDLKYTNPITSNTAESSELGTPIYFAASAKPFNNKDVSLGLSVTTPFGSSVKWIPDNWDGADVVKEISLKSFFIQPSIAYKVNDWLSLGYGLILVKSGIEISRSITPLGGSVVLEDDAPEQDNLGHNVGIYLKPTDELDFSVAYRSKVGVTANGEATFDIGTTLLEANDNFKGSLPLPGEITFAAAYKVLPNLTIAGGFNYVQWSAYKELELTFEKNTALNRGATPKEFDNQLISRFGLEYNASDLVDLRLGYYHQPSPVPNENWSAETPAFDYNTFTAGAGFNFKNGISIDTFFAYLKANDLTINKTGENDPIGPNGEYEGKAFLFGAGLNYGF